MSVKTVITKGIGTYGQYPISTAAEYHHSTKVRFQDKSALHFFCQMKKCLRIFKVNETREKIKNCQRGKKIICENLKPIRAEGEEQQDLF